jgi:hypothetical protein
MPFGSKCILLASVSLIVGCNSSPEDIAEVQVFASAGIVQCQNNVITLAQSEMILVQGGIDVLASACGTINGISFPAVCGAGTSYINVHRVRRVNLAHAEQLGYRSVEDIGTPAVPGTGFTLIHCDTRLPIQ